MKILIGSSLTALTGWPYGMSESLDNQLDISREIEYPLTHCLEVNYVYNYVRSTSHFMVTKTSFYIYCEHRDSNVHPYIHPHNTAVL